MDGQEFDRPSTTTGKSIRISVGEEGLVGPGVPQDTSRIVEGMSTTHADHLEAIGEGDMRGGESMLVPHMATDPSTLPTVGVPE